MRAHRGPAPRETVGDDRGPERPPARPGLVAVERRPPTSASLLRLQRSAGNRVARRVLLGGAAGSAATPVVQRAAYGLDLAPSRGKYVDEAVRLWTTQPGMALVDFAEAMLRTISVELTAAGVPPVGRTIAARGSGADGVFDSSTWTITVNTSAFSTQTPPPKTLRDLTEAEVTEVIGTLYHEARHADQDVMIVRDLLGQKKTVKQVVAATGIHKDAVVKIKGTTYPTALDPDQVGHARRMFDVMYGPHKEILDFLTHHSDAWAALSTLAVAGSPLSAAKKHLTTLAKWQAAGVQPHRKRLAAVSTPTPVEQALGQRLEKVDTALTALLAAWKKVATAKNAAPAAVDAVRKAAVVARDAIMATYLNLEGELDAFRVQAEVTTAFTAAMGAP